MNQTWCSETTYSNSRRTTCKNNLSKVQKPVGLLSLDEFELSRDFSSYLVNSQFYWTLTPRSSSIVWRVEHQGIAGSSGISGVSSTGVRPVINIQSNISAIFGTGTLQDPFVIEDQNMRGNLNEYSLIGEYVTYAGRNYRVVETSDQGTKLILDGYSDQNNDGIIEEVDKTAYGENCTLCTTINEESFINWISNSNEIDKNKLVSTTWYRGEYWIGENYKNNLESASNPYEGRVGLIRVGEILSGQIETILSKNHTTNTSYGNAQNYWTSTLYSIGSVWDVKLNGVAQKDGESNPYSIRPVIMISPDVQILSGNGTFNSPYTI